MCDEVCAAQWPTYLVHVWHALHVSMRCLHLALLLLLMSTDAIECDVDNVVAILDVVLCS